MSLEDAVVRTVGLTSVTGAIGAAHDAGGAPGAPAYVGEERYDAVTTIHIPAIIIAVVSAARNHLRGCMHFLCATPVGGKTRLRGRGAFSIIFYCKLTTCADQ